MPRAGKSGGRARASRKSPVCWQIPLLGQLRALAGKYRIFAPNSNEMVHRYYDTFQCMLDSADFEGVTWSVVSFDDDTSNKIWRLDISADLLTNRKPWMRAIREARQLATRRMGCPSEALIFAHHGNPGSLPAVEVSLDRIIVKFRSQDQMRAFCKKYHISKLTAGLVFESHKAIIKKSCYQISSLKGVIESLRERA